MSTIMDAPEILSGQAAVAEGEARLTGRAPARGDQYRAGLLEAAQIWGDALNTNGVSGLKARARLMEALTTSDFPILLGGVFERELLAKYQAAPSVWAQFASRTTVRDFRPKDLVDIMGGQSILSKVKEGAEYPRRKLSEGKYSLSVGKTGAILPLTWEDIINDDLDAFRDAPDRLAQAAKDTEDYTATSQLVTASGANSAFFKPANGNQEISGTKAPLTAANLDAAITAVSTRKDKEGRPILLSGFVLMVPPALETQALRILNATEIEITEGGTQTLHVGNYLRSKVTLVVNPWLTVIATDANAASRWFLLPQPATARPAVMVGFLRGHEAPDLRVKADTGSRVGGGAISPEEGSFDVDSVEYRVRHVIGATTVDPISTFVSAGA